MLFLQFEVGEDRYVLDCAQVIEVLPLLAVKQLPQAPAGVAGVFDYRGEPVPAIDLSELMLGRPARARTSTRIVVVHYPDWQGQSRPLGLIAERVTQTLRRDEKEFVASGVENRDTPYLGPVAPGPHGLIQWVDARRLLPPKVRDVLFQTLPEAI